MQKRGISPLIATILIIGFTIILAALIMTWGLDLYKSIKEEQDIRTETEFICASKIAPVVKASCVRLLPYVKLNIQNNAEKEISSYLIRVKGSNGIGIKNFTSKINPYGVINSFVAYQAKNGLVNEIEFIPRVMVRDKERSCNPYKFSPVDCDRIDFNNLVGFWPMDEGEGNIVYDYSINENDGTIDGALWINTKLGNGLDFDGIDDKVSLKRPVDWGTNTLALTFIKTKEIIGGNQIILRNFWDGLSPGRFCSWLYGNFCANFNKSMDINKEYFLSGGFDKNNNLRIYLNNLMVASYQNVNFRQFNDLRSFGGPSDPDNWGNANFYGIIDSVAIYNRDLTFEEINETYNALK